MMPSEDLVYRIRRKFLSGDQDAIEYAVHEVEQIIEGYRNGAFQEAAGIAEDGNPVTILAGTNKGMPVGLLTATLRTNIGKAIRARMKMLPMNDSGARHTEV